MTLSTTHLDEHFYFPINICTSGGSAKLLPCEASTEQYIWGSLQFVDLLSSGAASRFSVKPQTKRPLLSCSFGGGVHNHWNHWRFLHWRGGSSQRQVLTLKELKTDFKILHFPPPLFQSLVHKRGCFLAAALWKKEAAAVSVAVWELSRAGSRCEEVTKMWDAVVDGLWDVLSRGSCSASSNGKELKIAHVAWFSCSLRVGRWRS